MVSGVVYAVNIHLRLGRGEERMATGRKVSRERKNNIPKFIAQDLQRPLDIYLGSEILLRIPCIWCIVVYQDLKGFNMISCRHH